MELRIAPVGEQPILAVLTCRGYVKLGPRMSPLLETTRCGLHAGHAGPAGSSNLLIVSENDAATNG